MKESQNIELKETWNDEYLKWICGFTNAQGGKLYIGIRDDGSICGISNVPDKNADVPRDVPRAPRELNTLQVKILDLIKNDPKITRAKMAEACDVSMKTIARNLSIMRTVVFFDGKGGRGIWVIASPGLRKK